MENSCSPLKNLLTTLYTTWISAIRPRPDSTQHTLTKQLPGMIV